MSDNRLYHSLPFFVCSYSSSNLNKMNMRTILRKINAVVWFNLAVFLMNVVHGEWSKYGDYTTLSFVSSLVVYGGLCLMCGLGVDSLIIKLTKDK